MDYLTTHTTLSPIRRGFAPGFVNYKKGALDSQPASVKVYQLLAHGRWFSPVTPASSTTKTGRHDIAEILLKVALNTKKIKSSCFKLSTVTITYVPLQMVNCHNYICTVTDGQLSQLHMYRYKWSTVTITYVPLQMVNCHYYQWLVYNFEKVIYKNKIL